MASTLSAKISPIRRLWPGAFNSLAIGGRLVTAGAHGGGNVDLDVKRLYLRRQSILGAAGTNPPDVEKALDAARRAKSARSITARCRSAPPPKPTALSNKIRSPES